ncbi:bacterial proteasome activator family protein [Ilumatobacter sp.]|uniref:bacterial proteasome activator family protein n=1 Tax=Ilumatobacter sp. TaxID=1967498 RepID=UPI003AF6B10C
MTDGPQMTETPAEGPIDASSTTDGGADSSESVAVEHGELVDGPDVEGETEPDTNSVTEPAKVMRIGSMVKQLLEEVRQAPLDEASRERLAEVYERSVVELSEALSPDLQQELRMLTLPFNEDEVPSEGELRVAQAQLVGWLEGLFHGIQATLFAQQLAARQQLEQMRQLPAGAQGQPGMPGQMSPQQERPGTYL